MYHHPYLISSPWLFDGAHQNSLRVVDIVISRQWTPQTGCSILMESSQRAPNGWDTTSWTQVSSHSVGELVDLIFIGSTRRSHLHPQIWIEIWMGRRIVPISLPQPAIIGLLKFFLKNSSYSIQENNSLQNKMNERTYHEVLNTVVQELLHPLLTILTPHMRLYKQLHWTRFTSKRCSL